MTRCKASYLVTTLTILVILVAHLLLPTPTHAASISATPTSATVGTSVTVNGTGFAGHIAKISWDDVPVIDNITIDDKGSFTASFDIPHSSRGSHTILVTDDSNWSGSTASLTMTVLPEIRVFPEIGRNHADVTILGSGFAAQERDIKVTWNNVTLTNVLATADMLGKWSAKINVPQAAKGEHYIGAFGSVTNADEIGQVKYIYGPIAVAQKTSGPVGTKVTINGVGFLTSEDGITITYDKVIGTTNIVANSEGAWEDVLIIPPSTHGHHTIGIYGSDFTPIGVVPDLDFEVVPHLEVEVVTLPEEIRMTTLGTGFAEGETITLSFNNVKQDTSIVADNKGSFESKLTISQYEGKEHYVSADGNKGNSAAADFTIEKIPPKTPKLSHPYQGTTITIFNSISGVFLGTIKYLLGAIGLSQDPLRGTMSASGTKFDWSEQVDSKYIVYTLQIATSKNFSMPLLTKKDLTTSEYTLTKQDGLTAGSYFWRVKALDNVGNESPWSDIREFEVIYMPLTILIISIAIPTAIIIALGIVILIWRSRRSDW